jgi:hypothetical protein
MPAEVPFDPGQGGVAQPVGGDALGGDPGESFTEPVPELVVAAVGQPGAVAEAQQPIGREVGATCLGVLGQPGGKVEGDGLPAQGTALLGE